MKTKIVTGVLSVLTMAGLTFIWGNATFAAGQTCVWTGAAGDELFSTATNWSGCGGAAPTADDVLSFDRDVLTATTNELTNDLPAVAFAGVETSITTPANNTNIYDVKISTLRLADGGYIHAGPESVNSLERLGVGIGNADYSVGLLIGEGDVEFKGSVQAVSYNVEGTATVMPYNYSYASIYFKETDTVGGVVMKGSSDGTTGSSTLGFMQSSDDNTAAFSFPIAFTSDNTEGQITVTGKCDAYSGMTCTAPVITTTTISGPVTLAMETQVYIEQAATAVFTGTISGGTLKKFATAPGTLQIGTTVVVPPAKTTEYSGNNGSDAVVVDQNETAVLNEGSVRLDANVASGGTLKGVGTLRFNLRVYDGGKVAPGMSPGCLTTGTLGLSGDYQFEVGGSEACIGYDQIKVTATTGTTVLLAPTSTITTSRFNNFTPTQGQVYVIIDNQSAQPVSGTFKDLPEGATFTQNGVVYKVSYVGGTGNDVTLTVMNQPTAPNTGFELVKSNPIVTAAAAIMATIALLVIGRRLQTQR